MLRAEGRPPHGDQDRCLSHYGHRFYCGVDLHARTRSLKDDQHAARHTRRLRRRTYPIRASAATITPLHYTNSWNHPKAIRWSTGPEYRCERTVAGVKSATAVDAGVSEGVYLEKTGLEL
jgi:hypothetical protein